MKTEKITDGIWFYEFNPLSQVSPKGQFTIKAGEVGVPVAMLPMPLGGINSKMKQEANAQLIAEAGTVKNETGFSPRQLADRNKKLLEAVKEAIRHVVESCTRLGLDHTKHSTWQKCNKLIKSTKI